MLAKDNNGCMCRNTNAEGGIRVVFSPFGIGGKNIQIGASIGISHAWPEVPTVEELIK